MEEAEVRSRLEQVFRRVFQDDQFELRDDMTGWDSIVYIALIVAVEQAFSIQLTTNDIRTSKTAGDLVQVILSRSRPSPGGATGAA